MRFKIEIISKSAQYCMTFPPGFNYGFNVKYQTDLNKNAGNNLVDAFVKQHGGRFEEQFLLLVLFRRRRRKKRRTTSSRARQNSGFVAFSHRRRARKISPTSPRT